MAFFDLFKSLNGTKEEDGSVAHRNFSDCGPRKRESTGEQPGAHWKRQKNTTHDAYTNKPYPHGAERSSHHGGPDPQNTDGSGWKKKKKKKKKKNNQHQVSGRGWNKNGDGKGRPGRRYAEKEVRVKRMDPKFKERNVIELDGRMMCRHFFLGACIKGDECQLEHVQGYNDLIKECCKFYIQGCCMRGQSCPFMHSSVPCKFFHKRGACGQGANCKFSHEPLNDVTERLLEAMLKRENDLIELPNTAREEPPGPPVKPEVSDSADVKPTPDVVTTLPLRPNFYNSAEKEIPPEASEEDPPSNDDISSQTNHQPEPVCYSVEAVLGPSLSKPFTVFQTNSGAQESTLQSADASLSKNEVPYSVDAVLGSCKAERNAFDQTTAPPAVKTRLYHSTTDPIENLECSQGSRGNKQEVLLDNDKERWPDSQKNMFKTSTHNFGAFRVSEKLPTYYKTIQSSSCEAKVEKFVPSGPKAETCRSSNIKGHVEESPYRPTDTAQPTSFRRQIMPDYTRRNLSSNTFSSPLTKRIRGEITESLHNLQNQSEKVPDANKDGVRESDKEIFKIPLSPQDFKNSCGPSPARRQDHLKRAPISSREVKPKLLLPLSSPKIFNQPKTPDSTSFSTLFARPITDILSYTPPLEMDVFYSSKFDLEPVDKPSRSSEDQHETESLDLCTKVTLKSQEENISSLPSLQDKDGSFGLSKTIGDHEQCTESLETPERPFNELFARPLTQPQKMSHLKGDPRKELSFDTAGEAQAQEEVSRSPPSLHESKSFSDQTSRGLTKNKESRSPDQINQSLLPLCDSETKMFKPAIAKAEINQPFYQSINNQNDGRLDCRKASFSSLFAKPISLLALCAPTTETTTEPPKTSNHQNEKVSLDKDKTLCKSQGNGVKSAPQETSTSSGLHQACLADEEQEKNVKTEGKGSSSSVHENEQFESSNIKAQEEGSSSRPIDTTQSCKSQTAPGCLSNKTFFTSVCGSFFTNRVLLNRNDPKEMIEPLQSSADQNKDAEKEGVILPEEQIFRSLQETKSYSDLTSVPNKKHQEFLKSRPNTCHKVWPSSVSEGRRRQMHIKEGFCQHTDTTQSKGQRSPTNQDCHNVFMDLFAKSHTGSLIPCSPHSQGDNTSLQSCNLKGENKCLVQTSNETMGNFASFMETKPLSGVPQATEDHMKHNETLESSQRSSCEVKPEFSCSSKDIEKSASSNIESEIRESSIQTKDQTQSIFQNVQRSSPSCRTNPLDGSLLSLFAGAFTDGGTSNPTQPKQVGQSGGLAHPTGNEEPLPPSGNSNHNRTPEPRTNEKVLPDDSPSRGSILKSLFLNLGPFQEDGNQRSSH